MYTPQTSILSLSAKPQNQEGQHSRNQQVRVALQQVRVALQQVRVALQQVQVR